MIAVLGAGFLSALKYFSGEDPLKVNPQIITVSFLSSDKNTQLIDKLFSWAPPGIALPIKNIINKQIQSLAEKNNQKQTLSEVKNKEDQQLPLVEKEMILKFALVADSHQDNDNLKKALEEAKEKGAKFIIGLGDYTQAGELTQLQKVKNIFTLVNLPYYLTPGDHDLWAARQKGLAPQSYFSQMFGSPYQSFADSKIRFIIVYNSDNYLGVDELEKHWLEDELERVKKDQPKRLFIFLHEPLYHPSSDHMMGKGDMFQNQTNPQIQKQAEELITVFKEAGAGEIFAGDTHFYTRYEDPKSGLKMTTVGALTNSPNAQRPRFSLVDVYQDGSYNVEDLEIK